MAPPLVENPPYCLSNIDLTVSDILNAIDEIRPNDGTSENDIPATILKHCKLQLSYTIFLLWKKSLETGLVPPVLKEQFIAPIYKNISLTSHLIKIFERIVRNNVVTFLEDNNLLSTTQHGFRKGRSCLTQLLHHFESLLQDFIWANDNNMELNESKFDLLCYNHRLAAKLIRYLPFSQSLFEYETSKGTLISSTDHVQDLVVTMSYDYSWSAHIAKTAEDSKKMLHWVLSVFRDRSKLTMLTLYKSMVRSKLEYCCPLWDPSAISDIRKLEDVQRLFTSRVADCQEMSYWERLKALNLQSL